MSKDIHPWTDRKFTKLSRTTERYLGVAGRMLYTSKSMKEPTTIFSANIVSSSAKKIWFGDFEIERDKEALLRFSKKLGTLYMLYEMDGRFPEHIPTIEYVKSKAAVTFESGEVLYGNHFKERVKMLNKRMRKSNYSKLRRH